MAADPKPLKLWDRDKGKAVEEFMPDHQTTYETRPLRAPGQWLRASPLFDKLVALYQDAPWTTRQIEPFVREYHIDMSEFEPRRYRSYADFFVREFKSGVRRFPDDPKQMGAPAEARYFGWEHFRHDEHFPVKGQSLRARDILGSAETAEPFIGGPVLLMRLSPVDYHHVHYSDDGHTLEHRRLGRSLWTVAWTAVQNKPDIYIRNERQVNILETRHFGRLGFVEFGALTVGRIVQRHALDQPFRRGAGKSVFKFGGSAVAIFGEPGAWRPTDDILEHTPQGMETIVRLGEPVATSLKVSA
ncbi:phosphatidylserine decarboxylase [Methylobacterium sp. NMS12]|uniref:phosphatidylserine decarboxylase n=1 Tax=Methylobacterium sp. NMS12 TaxID=3079766 RepID=UPI003F883002